MLEEEKKLFEITLSQWINTKWYSLGITGVVIFLYGCLKFSTENWNFLFYLSLIGLVFCGGFIFYHYLQLKFKIFKISNQRIEKTEGIISRTTTNLELYRVKDLKLNRSLIQRMVGIGSIELYTSDQSDHSFSMNGIKNYEEIYRTIRHHVESTRIARGVREVDQNDHWVSDN